MTPTHVNNYAAFSINPSMVISFRIYKFMQFSGHSPMTSNNVSMCYRSPWTGAILSAMQTCCLMSKVMHTC